jgi:Coenzyme PQQ synthesis protein D (PqqD)
MAEIREELADESVTVADAQDAVILDGQARIPQHVVFRDFVNETVVLNLETGTYHGLNRTAGLMLTALDRAASVRQAATSLAQENGWDLDVVERDIVELCQTLLKSGLIEVADPSGA